MATENIDYEDLKRRGFLRQKQDGFFVLRTKMSFGAYSKASLAKIGEIAEQYGKGIAHATMRQGLEVPFIKFEDINKIEKDLVSSGISVGTSGPRLRTTTICPGNNWCRMGLINTFLLEEKIANIGLKCGLDLPHKFKIAISGCPNGCTRPQFSDLGIHGQAGAQKQIGYAVYVGGCGGRISREGIKLEKILTEEEVLSLAKRIVDFFKANALPRQRLVSLIDEIGKDKFLTKIEAPPTRQQPGQAK